MSQILQVQFISPVNLLAQVDDDDDDDDDDDENAFLCTIGPHTVVLFCS